MPGLVPGSPERRVLERVTSEVDHMRSTLDALLRIALAETARWRASRWICRIVASVSSYMRPPARNAASLSIAPVAPGATVQGSRQLLAQGAGEPARPTP